MWHNTHPFNGPLSGTTQVSQYLKGKTNLDFTEARDSEWPWHQLGHMQVCTLLQTDNHSSTPPLSFYMPDALPATQLTASKHWRQVHVTQVAVKWLNWTWWFFSHTIYHTTYTTYHTVCFICLYTYKKCRASFCFNLQFCSVCMCDVCASCSGWWLWCR